MLRGCYAAKIDDKSRLKIPRDFLTFVEEKYGRWLFLTTFDDGCARLFPLPVWEKIEERVGAQGLVRDEHLDRFIQHTSRYGQMAEIDNQGRILIHQRLREKTRMSDEVDVVGALDHLKICEREKVDEGVGLTHEDMVAVAKVLENPKPSGVGH